MQLVFSMMLLAAATACNTVLPVVYMPDVSMDCNVNMTAQPWLAIFNPDTPGCPVSTFGLEPFFTAGSSPNFPTLVTIAANQYVTMRYIYQLPPVLPAGKSLVQGYVDSATDGSDITADPLTVYVSCNCVLRPPIVSATQPNATGGFDITITNTASASCTAWTGAVGLSTVPANLAQIVSLPASVFLVGNGAVGTLSARFVSGVPPVPGTQLTVAVVTSYGALATYVVVF